MESIILACDTRKLLVDSLRDAEDMGHFVTVGSEHTVQKLYPLSIYIHVDIGFFLNGIHNILWHHAPNPCGVS